MASPGDKASASTPPGAENADTAGTAGIASAAARRERRGRRAAWSRLVFSDDDARASRIRLALCISALHVLWGIVYLNAAGHGEMSAGGALWLVATNVIGAVGFYPWLRSGATDALQDRGLVLPQMMWASLSAASAYAVAPLLRLPVLQVLCVIQAMGLFSLRSPTLARAGIFTVVMLALLLCLGLLGRLPDFTAGRDGAPLVMTAVALSLITRITMMHSDRRGRLLERGKALNLAIEAVQELLVRDVLTGLYNRRHMEELLKRELALSRRSGHGFCVAIVDLDHFKHFNDTFGHAAGDAALRRFGRLATGAMRSTDVVARWGGEEFLVLTTGNGPRASDLRVPLQGLREAVAAEDATSDAPPLRFSAGVTWLHAGESHEDAIARADRALYEAKQAGRDRTVVHGAADPPSALAAAA